ncbi:MAG: M6 family metalloprotease domain-containing protein [Paludibacter sp.]
MKRIYKITASLLLSFIAISGYAVTAYPFPIDIKQPDGTKMTILLKGDEKVKWAETSDGFSILFNAKGFYEYATLSADKELITSGVIARNPVKRTTTETTFLKSVDKHLVFSSRQISYMKGLRKAYNNEIQKAFPTSGERKLVCILMSYPDLPFTKTQTDFDNLFNQIGYAVDGATGSVKDYHNENSYGKLNLTVKVAGPYLSKFNKAYYGGNDANNNDLNPEALIAEAVKDADPDVNYSDYDNDNDGNVDGVYVIFAGYGEESGGGKDAAANAIWSHSWSISPVILDGKTIKNYSCSSELRGSAGTGITRIGVICHEFGHILGAPDFYDTDWVANGSWYGTGFWDLMGSGNWNNEGATPAPHNAYTKTALFGWATPTTLTTNAKITLTNSAENGNNFYRVDTKTANEYFLIENKQNIKFDASLPGHGMLIYHVDQNYIDNTIGTNLINASKHQGMYPVCANATGNASSTTSVYGVVNGKGCTFPGIGCKTAFTDATTPYSKSWAAVATEQPITSIIENTTNNTVSFAFMGGELCTPPTTQATSLNCTSLKNNSMTVNWTRGNGDSVLVISRAKSQVNELPANGVSYTANATFGSGAKIGLDDYVVYKGTGNSVDVSSLTIGTTYWYAVYEYSAATGCYLTPSLIGSATTTGVHPYCAAGSTDASYAVYEYDYISNVAIGSINQASKRGVAGYEDYTSKSTTLQIGVKTSAVITVAHRSTTDQVIVWVDWNQDGDFSATEKVFASSTLVDFVSPYTLSFNTPATALLGTTRMRIREHDVPEGGNSEPCGNSKYGEIEDYTVNIVAAGTAPTTQASAFTASALANNAMTVAWTRGDGDLVLVVARADSAVNAFPNGIPYTANATFGSGTEIGGGNYVVYNGTGTSVNVTALHTGTTYHYAIYEYASASKSYLTPPLTGNGASTGMLPYCVASPINKGEFITHVSIGSIDQGSEYQAAGYQDYTAQNTTMQIGVKTTAIISLEEPADSEDQVFVWVDWNHDGDFDDAGENVYSSSKNQSFVNPHRTAVFAPPADAVLGTTRMRIRSHISNFGPNFTPCGTSLFGSVQDFSINVIAAATPPITQASTFTSSKLSGNSITIGWTRGNGNAVLVVARKGNAVNAEPNGIVYSAGAFGSGSKIGEGNYVVYNGTGSALKLSALTRGTTYYFSIYEYDSATNSYLAPALTGNASTTGVSPYCTTVSLTEDEFISNVTIGTINNESGFGTGGYEDYTSQSTSMPIGSTAFATINVANSYPGDRVLIWVDWNKDGDFDDKGENVYFSTNNYANPLITGSFAAPIGTTLGLTRMRIKLVYGVSGANMTACGDAQDGEVEDYSINITAATTGINQSIANSTFKVYPNPVKNELIIESANNEETASVEIINLTGQVVFKSELSKTTLVQTSSLPIGIYLVKLTRGKTIEFKKIIKQ